MTPLSKNAFVVMGMCSRTRQPFGITVDPVERNQLRLVWAFKINADKARREGYDKTKMKGAIEYGPEFPGCPYCESTQFYVCHKCDTIVCYHGEEQVTCPKCGVTAGLIESEQIELTGGGL